MRTYCITAFRAYAPVSECIRNARRMHFVYGRTYGSAGGSLDRFDAMHREPKATQKPSQRGVGQLVGRAGISARRNWNGAPRENEAADPPARPYGSSRRLRGDGSSHERASRVFSCEKVRSREHPVSSHCVQRRRLSRDQHSSSLFDWAEPRCDPRVVLPPQGEPFPQRTIEPAGAWCARLQRVRRCAQLAVPSWELALRQLAAG